MKKDSINKIKLGIFVTLGIAIFAAGIYFIGETRKLFSTTFRVSALFIDVNGLQVGNNVRFAGINVGSIEGIQIISDSAVKVDMVIDENTRKFIKKDSKAIIGSEGMMGNKLMVISPGSASAASIEHNDRLGTTIPVSFDEMIGTLKVTGDNAALITGDLAAILDDVRAGKGTAGKILYDKSFAKNLDNILVNLDEGTAGLKNTFNPAFSDDVKQSMAKVNDILANVTESTEDLKALMVEAKGSWLLGSFWGGSSDDDDDEDKLKKEDDKIINDALKQDKKKSKEAEQLRLKRIKKLYDEDVLREKQELEAKEKHLQDSVNNVKQKLLKDTVK